MYATHFLKKDTQELKSHYVSQYFMDTTYLHAIQHSVSRLVIWWSIIVSGYC
jgi:hypothetical protein